MSDFTPNGILYILKNVPLDPDYEKTLYFDDEQTQYDYFKSKRDTTLSWENRQYQKVGKGTLRVKALADKLYDCNYLMFQNRKYGNGNKWFYAFIREVRYINDDTSEIIYTLDVMQTWLFQYKDSMEECYVEREHTVRDELYTHLVPEDTPVDNTLLMNEYDSIDITDSQTGKWNIAIITSDLWKSKVNQQGSEYSVYVSPQDEYDYTTTGVTRKSRYCIATADSPLPTGKDSDNFPAPPYTVNGIITPLCIYCFGQDQIINESLKIQPIWITNTGFIDTKNVTLDISLEAFLNSVNKETIVYAFYYPASLGTNLSILSGVINRGYTPTTKNELLPFKSIKNADYTPVNKKLYSYPYSQLTLTNNQGQSKSYKFELFELGVAFRYSAVVLLNPEFRITPLRYSFSNPDFLIDAMSITELPELAFTVNAYQQYLINNGNRLAASFATDAINAGMGALLGLKGVVSPAGAIGKITGSVSSVAEKIAMLADKKNKASEVIGTANTPSLNFAKGEIRFEFRTMRITGEMAKIIDEYFTRYGYKCMEIKKPNLKARPYFTYTKTIQCEINASIPQDDLENIKSVFNMGTTFWYITEPTTGVFPQDEVIGEYLTVDNRPVTSTGG